jgi:hypothetical protein
MLKHLRKVLSFRKTVKEERREKARQHVRRARAAVASLVDNRKK